MKRIALLIIATGKYDCFLPRLLKSVNKYFLKDCEVDIHVFSDKGVHYEECTGHYVKHRPFPHTTLYRYHYFQQYKEDISNYDYYFYIDVDTEIKSEITSEILSERTAVQHCGYVGRPGTFETRIESTSFVHESLRRSQYFGGGFWGFSNEQFWQFIDNAVYMIDEDQKKNIVPIWNDESVLNKYLIMKKPTKILTPSYHYPESNLSYYRKIWNQDYECKILLLDKEHDKIRGL